MPSLHNPQTPQKLSESRLRVTWQEPSRPPSMSPRPGTSHPLPCPNGGAGDPAMEAAWAEAGEDAERDLPMGWQGRKGGAGASSSQDKHHGQPRTSSGSQLRCLCHQTSWEPAGTFVRTVGESSPALGTAAGFRQQQRHCSKPALRGCPGEKELATYHAALSYSAQIRTNSSRW